MRGGPLLIGGAAMLIAVGFIAALLLARPPPDPTEVVAAWTASRNAGDVDAALSLLTEEAAVFGFSIAEPGRREQAWEILAAQAVAGWTIVDSDCETDEEIVTCRYRMDDEILRRWQISFVGTHKYVVLDGRIARVTRVHDIPSRDRAYRALGAFKAWVRDTHPDLVSVIWSDPESVTYATPEGAAAMLELLDEFERAGTD